MKGGAILRFGSRGLGLGDRGIEGGKRGGACRGVFVELGGDAVDFFPAGVYSLDGECHMDPSKSYSYRPSRVALRFAIASPVSGTTVGVTWSISDAYEKPILSVASRENLFVPAKRDVWESTHSCDAVSATTT